MFDHVTIDAKNKVGFGVFENEIIVFYFTSHCHFKNQSSKLQDGERDYIEHAKIFLTNLFVCKIQHILFYKGKTLSREKHLLLYSNERKNDCIENAWYGPGRWINPFGKKTEYSTIWQFDKSKGVFTTRLPKSQDPDAVETVEISSDCYIEIFYRINVYTYCMMELDFDDDYCVYYWAPAAKVLPTGMYDTKERAILAAKETLTCRERLQ